MTSSDSDVAATTSKSTQPVPTVPYQPIPAPRPSKLREQRVATAPVLANANLNIEPANTTGSSLTTQNLALPSNNAGNAKPSLASDPFNMSALDFSVHEISKSTSNIPDKTNNNEPAEQSRNVSITRHNAFYNADRPASFKRRSLQPGYSGSVMMSQQAMKEARTAFIQSEVTKPDLSSGSIMDIFDPLTMGSDSSLSSIGSGNVSSGLKSGAHVDSGENQEDLLKEWNLESHFTKLKADSNKTGTLAAQHPPIPPQVPVSTVRPSIAGGAGFGGRFASTGPTPAIGLAPTQQVPGIPRPYQSLNATNPLLSSAGYNRNSMPPLATNSPIHAQLAALQQRSQSPQPGPPMLRPLSQRAPSPDKSVASRDSRGTSPAIAQTIASLSAAAEYHGNTKPKSRLPQGAVKKVITNIEQTQTNLDILNDLSFLQTPPEGAHSQRNTPSPSLQNNQTQRNQWETFE